MREIVLDTETTGMDPDTGDRIIEIGCVELINHVPTGKHLQLYIQPEREVPSDAIAVHGITNEFLKDKPIFLECYTEFTDFIGDDGIMVIHNAEFDMKFINHHLKEVGYPTYSWKRVVDTLGIARKKFPGSPANLDALCRRFGIDNTERTYHGALLDSELLAEVYLELLGGRQHGFSLLSSGGGNAQSDILSEQSRTVQRPYREPRSFAVAEGEQQAHAQMLQKIKDPLWGKA